SADIALGTVAGGKHRFGVVRPAELVPAPEGRVTDDPQDPPQEFHSRPDLRPPFLDITTPATGTEAGYIFLTTNVPGGQPGLSIVDDEGQFIWFSPPRVDTESLYELRVQEYQGQPVLTWVEAASPVGYGYGHFVIADSTYTRIADVQVGNGYTGGDVHEFLLTPRGTAFVIIYHPVEWDMSPVGGSRYASVLDNIVQEIEVETGRVLFEWHSLDHVGVEETYRGLNADEGKSFDYFHMNSIEEDPDGNLIVSARHTFAIYKIDRTTGEVSWRLNGKQSDFEMEEGTEFAWQHDARVHPNGELSLFDNHEADQDGDVSAYSRGMVLELDETAMTATLLQEYIHPSEILSTSQANMQVLPNGNVFIGWGSAPVFSEFSPDGDLIFNGRFPQGANSYRAYRFPWVGQPLDPPDIAVERRFDGSTIVYTSWNGATEVASWRIIAGATPETMEIASEPVPQEGFETAITVDIETIWYSAQALDASGTVIGTAVAIQPDS
ncbi:MAG TPA: arylsulfotransferase family protein, partial [Thermomicrobiales bacterium]|nr:arylsulfotransferase family protein [Thermomicrobiales bacterium]